jgi:hypothetical protein
MKKRKNRKSPKRPLGAHAWKGSCARNTYALIWAPRLCSWVRVLWFGKDDYVVLNLENEFLT